MRYGKNYKAKALISSSRQLRLKDGDILLMETSKAMSAKAVDQSMGALMRLKADIGVDFHALILEGGMKASVISVDRQEVQEPEKECDTCAWDTPHGHLACWDCDEDYSNWRSK